MRRLAVTLILAGALAAPAVAATPKAGTFKAAKVQRGYDLKFKVKGGKVTNLVAHVLETCDGSSTSSTTTVGPKLTWKIKGGKVSGRKKESSGGVTLYTTLEGRSPARRRSRARSARSRSSPGRPATRFKLKFTAKRG